MKKQRKVIRFDYTKLETEQDYRFWGIHPKAGRLHIDTKRYQKIILDRGFNEFIHDGMLVNRTTPYFIPEKIKQHDYKINLFKDFLHDLKEDWFYEYKPVFEKIKTPGEVQQNVRLAELSYMSSSEDYDLADEAGFMAMIKRMPKYDEIIHSLYIQFIQKICIEVNRYILLVCVELGYKSRDFDFNSFLKFSDGLTHNKNGIKIESLRGFNAYNLLNKINNFLKHNTVASYEKIRRYYPKNVRSVVSKTSTVPYQNGMYAGDWIIIKADYIDNLFLKLELFFEDYCKIILGENIDEAEWNYDDYFRKAYTNFIYPDDYFGF